MNLAALQLRAAATSAGMAVIDRHEPSMWLRGRITDMTTQWRLGRFTPCRHLRGPMIGVTGLWDPERIYCRDAACVQQLRLTGDADQTCDRCSHVTADVRPIITTAAGGRVIVIGGLCPRCFTREVPSP